MRGQIATHFDVAGTVHVLALGTREPPSDTPFGPEDHAYVELVASFFARQIEAERMERTLRHERERSQQHSERLSALWRIVNTPDLRGEPLRLAMLSAAAGRMRPGQEYIGTLGHLDGSIHVIDASVGQAGLPSGQQLPGLLVGSRIERSELMHLRDLNAPRTQTWDDCQLLSDLPERARRSGLRSVITTTFSVLDTTYVLTLGSLEATSGAPFSSEDREYVEVLGSFFARQLEREHMLVALSDAEVRARYHAERLATLWQIANNPTLRGQHLIDAMLQQGAAAIRPGQNFRGMLWRVHGADLIVEGLSRSLKADAENSPSRLGPSYHSSKRSSATSSPKVAERVTGTISTQAPFAGSTPGRLEHAH